MNRKLTLLLLFFGCRSAFAQVIDTTRYHISAAATGAINKAQGNNNYLLNNALNFGIKDKSVTLTAANSWVYGKQNGLLTNNDFSSTLFVNLYKTFKHFYYWGLVNYNTSYSLKINNQILAGAGVAYSIIDRKNAYFNLSDGVVYDQSDLLAIQNYHTYRNSFRVSYHFAVKSALTVDGSDFLQSSFSKSNDYIIRTTTTLGFKIEKWLALTTSLTYNKMNITRSDNLIFTYGLTIDKTFSHPAPVK